LRFFSLVRRDKKSVAVAAATNEGACSFPSLLALSFGYLSLLVREAREQRRERPFNVDRETESLEREEEAASEKSKTKKPKP